AEGVRLDPRDRLPERERALCRRGAELARAEADAASEQGRNGGLEWREGGEGECDAVIFTGSAGAHWRPRGNPPRAFSYPVSLFVQPIHPAHFLDCLGWRDIQIDDGCLLSAAHQHAFQRLAG